jgi:hypothetical protein
LFRAPARWLERTINVQDAPKAFYEKADYPQLNRAARKALEAERLGKISARAQTIKYADFLHNGEDILVQDADFAKVKVG